MAKKEPSQGTEGGGTIPVERDPSLIARYCNHLNIRSTHYDFEFSFGELVFEPTGKMTARETARIYMSPAHAKLSAMLLAEFVKKYEERIGVIQLPSAKEEDS